MKEDRVQFTMRIDPELWEKIKLSAEKNKRSAAKEVEYVLDLYAKGQLDELLKDV